MTKRFIALQAGHQNASSNCDTSLRGGTGAPGEAEFTVKVRDRLSQILLTKKNADGSDAFMLKLFDATANCDPNIDNDDYALFMPIHYDAYINGSRGGFADFPEPTTDFATKESQRITKVINETYFPAVGIPYVNRSNTNTRYYYMWKFLSAKTPCVLIECGTGQNPQEKPILQDTERVAQALAKAICKVFDVPFESSTPPVPTPPTPDYKKLYEDEVASHQAYRNKFNQANQDAAVNQALNDLNTRIDNAQKN